MEKQTQQNLCLLLAFCVVVLAGCGTVRVPTTSAVEIVTNTVTAPAVSPTGQTSPVPSDTPSVTALGTPTILLSSPSATFTSKTTVTVAAKGTSTRAAIPTAGTTQIKLFFVALNDNGKSGKKIGCDDSIVAVQKAIPQTSAPLTVALKELLAVRDLSYGQSGLYNALYQANVKLTGVAITNSKAMINLTGTLNLRGTCDNPRAIAQIQDTALQFPSVKDVAVLLNGVPLEQALSAKGQ